ncbi:bifunctional glycosyltransferase family 2 protein/CDP-glycerol:glycerophosphate glycerophosphotransferase [Streptomyces sp. JJ38]|uniref:bifunctional glycosyltransferase/CDP-glycerol:glycerophosphate glycerophosphotransferase n=1 Tax=Streptomyces sp. JJ38 TaxID=2738128 RepID=UPI001C5604B5|nr:bifunctional glycosyltransferase family 2 protein/CDP-glycerol:glycerophosphate glycerophosphotransferase [Streptomyces sp. JJ38]MBW1598874.1 bifunctional glycosyltransferase family 2 protein/CDP-glycerol:glycerophosphate glycerophosphotransferase [Streptomyces sp. JJ38]
MPRLTLVVPAYNVQGYIRECLDSIVGQDFDDFEIVGVDDCSPDASGAILDEYAARDDRVRVLHLPQNVGLGRARNAGLEVARGDYVLFLDSDDTLTPGSLRAIVNRLDATGHPDILIFDYARTYWDGTTKRNLLASLLSEEGTGAGSFPLDERPELLDLLQIVWNKAYRRDFVERQGFQFPPGYYEDAPWTFCSLIAADRLAVLDRICVHYRQRREGGNILRTVSRRHFDVFDQYERVFAYLDAHPELDRWRHHLFRKMVDHFITVLERPGRLPSDARADFFQRAVAAYRRRVPADFVRPHGAQGHKYSLFALGSYSAMAGTRAVSTARGALRRHGRRQINRAKRRAMGAYYASQLRRPLDENLAVFSAYWNRSYACNPAAIDTALARLVPGMRRVWVLRDPAGQEIPPGVEVVRPGSREYWAAVARAKYTVNNVNFPDRVVKRPGSVHLQTHHGTPLKSMGLDQQKFPASTKMNFTDLLRRCDRWDYSLSSNRFSTEIWERVYPCSFTSLGTGYPRNDVLVNATAADVRRARQALDLPDGGKVFLYAPTHREHEAGFTPRLDVVRLAERLGPDVTLMIRGHYFYGPSPELAHLTAAGRVRDVSRHPCVEDLYLASDALITDYSSAMFDYANLDRPIIVYADDWDIYRAVRGTYFDLMTEAPGVVTTSQDELTETLVSGAWDTDEAAKARAAFRERFCEFDDGRAAERVVRRVFLGEDTDSVLPVVPLHERAPVPTPAEALAPAERV